MIGLYKAMNGKLRQLSEPRLRQKVGIEKSQAAVERDILVQWMRKSCLLREKSVAILYRIVQTSSEKNKMHENLKRC